MIVGIAVSILAAFLVGYLIGKRQGWKVGCQETEAAMPLIIRQKSLELGQCVICGQSPDDTSFLYSDQSVRYTGK